MNVVETLVLFHYFADSFMPYVLFPLWFVFVLSPIGSTIYFRLAYVKDQLDVQIANIFNQRDE
jgi:hypothetical protein